MKERLFKVIICIVCFLIYTFILTPFVTEINVNDVDLNEGFYLITFFGTLPLLMFILYLIILLIVRVIYWVYTGDWLLEESGSTELIIIEYFKKLKNYKGE